MKNYLILDVVVSEVQSGMVEYDLFQDQAKQQQYNEIRKNAIR